MVLTILIGVGGAEALTLPTLNPATIPKYQERLVIPPAMPPVSSASGLTEYEIAVRQFDQQVLPPGMPKTTVWGYGAVNAPGTVEDGGTFNWPGFTIEGRVNERIRVKWVNGLVDGSGRYLPHLFPVDPTLHWANPPGPRDMEGSFTETPGPYTGPVPVVTHVHGAHVAGLSDGYPEAWYLPGASNIEEGYFTRGSRYGSVIPAEPGSAYFEYTNDQRATTLWYHDHALGITRLNVYAGLAGFWLLRGGEEEALDLPGPAPMLGDAPGTSYYEIPIAIQDRSFNEDGSLFFPDSREFFDGYPGPYLPANTVRPIWNPEFFGNAIVVNGKTWPYLEVEPRKYRFRFLNGCNARFFVLEGNGITFHQIGSEGGLLPDAPVALSQLLIAPAERPDVIIDFSAFSPGEEIILRNVGPDSPFGGLPIDPADLADPNTTGQIMKFVVVPATGAGNPGSIPTVLPAVAPLGPPAETRDLTLNEIVYEEEDIPTEAELGTGADGPLGWDEAMTEMAKLGDTEMWRLINLTEDAHPIHLHLVMFQVLDRMPIDAEAYAAAQEAYIAGGKEGPVPDPASFATGPAVGPESWETGWKDTVIAYPGEVTRLKATFDLVGLYVWHCHILDHEDNEMMRPYMVISAGSDAVYDPATLRVHIPCVDLGGNDYYWANLLLVPADTGVVFQVEDLDLSTTGLTSSCATFDYASNTLRIPQVDVGTGTMYSAELLLMSSQSPLQLELTELTELP